MTEERRGRPRSRDIDLAIVEAALDEVAATGYTSASISGIARRAGVPKSTLYRRWGSKQELFIEAMSQFNAGRSVSPTGDALADLFNEISGLVQMWQDPRMAAVMGSMVLEVPRHPGLQTVVEQRLMTPFREGRLAAILRQGIAEGQLRDDIDVDIVVEIVFAVPLHAHLRQRPVEISDLASRIMATLVKGLVGHDVMRTWSPAPA